jgi:hypothetical protein
MILKQNNIGALFLSGMVLVLKINEFNRISFEFLI